MTFTAGNRLGEKNAGSVKVPGEMFDKMGEFILGDGMALAQKALEDISKEDNKAYLDKLMGFMEYFKPKLARIDNNNNNSGEIKIILQHNGDKDSK